MVDTTTKPVKLHQAVEAWLAQAVAQGASDLHLLAGYPPVMRVHGDLQTLAAPALTASQAESLLLPLCPQRVRQALEREKNADFALQLEIHREPRRCRANLFYSGDRLGACLRIIPAQIPDFQWSGFPQPLAERLTHFRNGLVLIAGVAGSGKTTTLALMINLLVQEGGYRIITIEEPIEYVFQGNPRCIVSQREVGRDVLNFSDGLKYGLRQDPDVILVGEIRDRPTAQLALSAAETGHLVLSTLHTRDAKGAISRYADLFGDNLQSEIRSQLSMSLRAVVSQHMLPSTIAGAKRELALEVLFNNSAVASAIRFGRIETIDTNIVMGRSDGMISLDESVKRLLREGRISPQTAEHFVSEKAFLRRP